MDFGFNESQRMFRDSLREFLEKEIEPLVEPQEKKGPMNREEALDLMRRFKKVGIGFDLESLKDLGSDPITIGIMVEEMFRVWPSAAALVALSFPAGLVILGSEDMRKRWMGRVEKNEVIGCYAITEPEAGSDNRAMRTTAVLDGDSYVVNGTKTWISNAPVADLCLLVANDQNGERVFLLVEKEVSPFECSDLHKLGWRAAPTGEVYFDNCRVPRENNLMTMIASTMGNAERVRELGGDPAKVSDMQSSRFISNALSMGMENIIFAFLRSGMALSAAGISQAALDASLKYAKERVQFGRPIGKFQLIQEMLYNMTALTETSRLLGYKALWAAITGDPQARMYSSLAKGYACDAAVKVAYDAIQIHGGVGLSDEYPLERYFRDARMLTIPDGTSEIQKLIVGRELLGKGFAAYA
ncbi:MAG: acyl-CoA dehydrogenase family protein [Actinobacteria bacterium]|nr:acyl-CoA dehydrogenase family protein [Actinomycetota bacterium]